MKKCCSCDEEAEYTRDGVYYCGDHARGQISSIELTTSLDFEEIEDDS